MYDLLVFNAPNFLLGLASFKTCDPGMLADPMLYPSNSARPRCHQDLNVTEGKVTLDTSLMYMPGGCCGCREYTQRLAIRFDRFDVSIEFNCNEVSIPCLNGEGRKGVVVSRHSDAHFDISLEVEVNLTSSDFKLFYIEIEVSRPGSSTVERFWKVFRVFVNPGKLLTPHPVTQYIVWHLLSGCLTIFIFPLQLYSPYQSTLFCLYRYQYNAISCNYIISSHIHDRGYLFNYK